MNRINYLMNGLAALAFIVLFSQCAGKADNQVATTPLYPVPAFQTRCL